MGIATRLVHLSSFYFHKYSRESNKVKRKLVNLAASWTSHVYKLMIYFFCLPPNASVC